MSSEADIEIEIFTDFVCPWCYLSTASVARLWHEYPNVKLQWRFFPLHPDTPPEGLLLAELFRGRDMTEIHDRLSRLMDEAGLAYRDRIRTFNSRLAQEMAKWAETQRAGDRLHEHLYRAYFVDEQNLADPVVLLQVVAEAGLNRDAAAEVLANRSFSAEVDADWQLARQYRISGVPCFIGGGYMLSGSQPYEELQRFVEYLQRQAAMM
jgi:predicted DsbA family dithiol-disulfide isomerase